MLPLCEILNQFGWRYEVIPKQEIHDISISTVELGMKFYRRENNLTFASGQSRTLKGHAEILRASDFLRLSIDEEFSLLPEVFFILVSNSEFMKGNELVPNALKDCIFVFIESEMEPEDFYIYCIRSIHSSMNDIRALVSKHYIHLADLLTREVDIGEIEAVANEILRNPMIVTDESYKVIAHSKKEKVDDPIWTTIVENAYCPSTIVEMTDTNHFWKRLKKVGRPLFVDSDDFSPYIRRAVAEIRSGGKTKGYIALLEVNKRISDQDLDVLQMVAELVGVKMKEKDAVSRALGKMESEFISDLLDGTMNNEKMVQNRAESLGWKIQPWYAVLCVHGKEKARYIGPVLETIKNKLLSFFPFCVYSFNGDKAYFIVGFDNHNTSEYYKRKNVERIMEEGNLISYAGLPFQRLIQVSESYKQAQNSFHVAQLLTENISKKSFYSYSEMAVYDLLFKYSQIKDSYQISSRALSTLIELDKKEGSEYVLTLRNFFESNQNVPATAEKMYLHRNTVNYRLNKIRQFIEDDFDSPAVRLHIYLSLIMFDFGLQQREEM